MNQDERIMVLELKLQAMEIVYSCALSRALALITPKVLPEPKEFLEGVHRDIVFIKNKQGLSEYADPQIAPLANFLKDYSSSVFLSAASLVEKFPK